MSPRPGWGLASAALQASAGAGRMHDSEPVLRPDVPPSHAFSKRPVATGRFAFAFAKRLPRHKHRGQSVSRSQMADLPGGLETLTEIALAALP